MTWRDAGFDADALDALRQRLPASRLWSLLLGVAEARADAVAPSDLMRQWQRDRFVAPAPVGARRLLEIERLLFDAGTGFEDIELSPLAPLGVCAAVAPGSQDRIVATMRGTEVVSDPTNVLALECALRLRAKPDAEVKLATAMRVTRAQAPPAGSGYAAHFKLFCLASASHERAEHGFAIDALAEHIGVHWRGLDALAAAGFDIASRRLRVLVAPGREHLGHRLVDRLAPRVPAARPAIEPLDSRYYDGLRFMIDVGGRGSQPLPLIDGGLFDWLQVLSGNRKLRFVASAIGTQLLAARFDRA